MEHPSSLSSSSDAPPSSSKLLLLILIFGWLVIVTFLTQWGVWGAEQVALAMGTPWPAWARPGMGALFSLFLLVPLLAARRWKQPRYRAAVQTWLATAVYTLCLLPVRLAPPNAAQLANLLQIGGTLLYLIGLRRLARSSSTVAVSTLPAWLLAPAGFYGWLVWGSLGSWLDSLLNLVAALLLGWAAAQTFSLFFGRTLPDHSRGRGWDLTVGGFVAGVMLTMMGAAFGFNGLQLVLMVTLPAVAWVAVIIADWGGSRALALFIGLTAAAPALFVDPDELGLLLNLGSRDIGAWAAAAALVSLLLGWVAGLVLFWLRQRLPQNRKLLGGATAVAWLLALFLYLQLGQPGFYGERLFVILRNQADVSAAVALVDPSERRQVVYDILVAHANSSQADLRTTFDRFGFDYTPYYLLNAIEVNGGPLLKLWLMTQPDVDRVLDEPVLRPLPELPSPANGTALAPTQPQWNLTSIGAPRAWEEFGARGQGIVIGQSDSGVEGSHPELAANYRGQDGNHDYNWYDPWNQTAEPTDWGGHGTHTLGSIVGQSVGVAPEASWIGCVNLARNLGNPGYYLDCLQFMLAPFPQNGDPLGDGDPRLGANVLNNSWGCPMLEGCDALSLQTAVAALRAAGTFVVASAGNEGSLCESINDPIAIYDDAFSVGAVDQFGQLADFSSRGPVTADGSGRIKPDIIAPGVAVLSAYPGGTYEFNEGTSMAGPHVAGVVALIWSANPALIGQIDQTEQILIATAVTYDYNRHGIPNCGGSGTYPNNAVGYGLVDAYAAVQRALVEK